MVELSNLIQKKCIFVLGATASGKSSWALEQAQKFNGSIVNIDSVQLYNGLLIGSAAPTEAEKNRVPHYLYSYVKAPAEMTAGQYLTDFYQMLEVEKPRFPIFIVGGTGFYIQALEKGMFDVEPVPIEIKNQLELELKTLGVEKLFNELREKAPETKIHVNDHYRIVRALEIIRFTGQKAKPMSENKNKFPYSFIKVGFDFDKTIFEERVKKRTDLMINNGLIDEVQNLLSQGLINWAPLSSVGYKECVAWLQLPKGEQNVQKLSLAIQQSTMQLIKKQKTWFKRDLSILWSNQYEKLSEYLL